jgi:hypothetical protein
LAIKQGAARYDTQVAIQIGRAEFVGNTEGSGREQRDRARQISERSSNESHVEGSAENWSGVRDRWSAANVGREEVAPQDLRSAEPLTARPTKPLFPGGRLRNCGSGVVIGAICGVGYGRRESDHANAYRHGVGSADVAVERTASGRGQEPSQVWWRQLAMRQLGEGVQSENGKCCCLSYGTYH